MRPAPHDVLVALDRLQPGAGSLVAGRDRHPHPVAIRRVFVAVCCALGWSLPRIGRQLGRDHTTIMHYRDTYLRNRMLAGREDEEDLFRALIRTAHEVANRRGVVHISDYRGRAA